MLYRKTPCKTRHGFCISLVRFVNTLSPVFISRLQADFFSVAGRCALPRVKFFFRNSTLEAGHLKEKLKKKTRTTQNSLKLRPRFTYYLRFCYSCACWLSIQYSNKVTPDLPVRKSIGKGSQFNPLVPGNFFSSNFFPKLGGKVHCMNRLGNLKVQS